LQEIFRVHGEMKATHSVEYKVSILEVHNELIRDLLGKDKERKHEIKQLPDGQIYVSDLHEITVNSLDEVLHLVGLGNQVRSRE
jgi:kinesin family protein C2/C3